MSIEALKEQARRHEHREEWRKALDQYKKAIARLEADDQPDIGLYNRVGDLFVRVGALEDAVRNYERAVDLYMEAELPNNAIAVLKKVIRNVPQRHSALLRMGQVRAAQGFLPDARASFLSYAELMQQAGDLDESFRALVEFCDLDPDDVDLRRAVADQMASRERIAEAVGQLVVAHRHLTQKGEDDEAAALETRIRELDPEVDLEAPAVAVDDDFIGTYGQVALSDEEGETAWPGGDVQVDRGFGNRGEEDDGRATGDDAVEGEHGEGSPPPFESDLEEEVTRAGGEPVLSDDDSYDLGEEESDELPLLEADVSEYELDSAAEELVFSDGDTYDLDEEVAIGEEEAEVPFDANEVDQESEELPLLDLDVPGRGEDEPEVETTGVGATSGNAIETAMEDARAEAGFPAEAPPSMDELRAHIAQRPDDVSLRQRLVELAYREGDEAALAEAYMGLGEALQRGGLSARAQAAFQQVLQIEPGHQGAQAALGTEAPATPPVQEVASHEDYVDLGSLILGDEDEKTTRFVVAYEEPSGDEAADFAKMLAQFKEQVSRNLGADDVKAHHDLGTAYMEMGLLGEAIGEFQKALRASADHLATYELLGQAFIEMGRYEAAVQSLTRALEVPHEIEDDLVGIYYYLARAYEGSGNKESALEFYDRVFSLDINFADVTERLKALR